MKTPMEPRVGGAVRWLAVLGVLALTVAACSPKLEEGEVLEKNGDTFTIRLTKKLDHPIDKVWTAFQSPEELEKYSEQYQQTKLVKDEGNTKVGTALSIEECLVKERAQPLLPESPLRAY